MMNEVNIWLISHKEVDELISVNNNSKFWKENEDYGTHFVVDGWIFSFLFLFSFYLILFKCHVCKIVHCWLLVTQSTPSFTNAPFWHHFSPIHPHLTLVQAINFSLFISIFLFLFLSFFLTWMMVITVLILK